MKNLKFSVLLALALISLGGSMRAEFLYVSYGPVYCRSALIIKPGLSRPCPVHRYYSLKASVP